jgi:DNA repair protein RadC
MEANSTRAARKNDRNDQLPRERLLRCGPEALGNSELLALALCTGYRGRHVLEVAEEIFKQYRKEEIVALDVAGWARIKGVGLAKATQMVAAFELARRGLGKGMGLRHTISRPQDALPLLDDIREQRREYFLCLYLNARNQVIHREVISIGSLSASIVHPREVFQVAIAHSAAGIVLSHNHPSGDVSPSRDDIELTRRLVRAGQIMGIDILDHIVIATDDMLSLKECGLL